ncbi:MAG: hypothetical protein HOP17_05225 [Acidobacteria bacterium]|nr:hypothetical protein [Acidobacteriota bacterium]
MKRVLPFFLTFAAGLFIASFFVSISSPSFNFPRKNNRHREERQLRIENDGLQRENADLRRQLEEAGLKTGSFTVGSEVFEADNAPPPPPPAPAKRPHRVLLDR